MENINENVNYLNKIYPLYKLSDQHSDKIYYMIYFKKTEDEIKPILFTINNIEKIIDKWYTVQYIEYIDENKSIVKALENDYFLLNNDNVNALNVITSKCPSCSKQFYHKNRYTCKDCPNNDIDNNKYCYCYYLISVNKY